jgi:hypothetical protein
MSSRARWDGNRAGPDPFDDRAIAFAARPTIVHSRTQYINTSAFDLASSPGKSSRDGIGTSQSSGFIRQGLPWQIAVSLSRAWVEIRRLIRVIFATYKGSPPYTSSNGKIDVRSLSIDIRFLMEVGLLSMTDDHGSPPPRGVSVNHRRRPGSPPVKERDRLKRCR